MRTLIFVMALVFSFSLFAAEKSDVQNEIALINKQLEQVTEKLSVEKDKKAKTKLLNAFLQSLDKRTQGHAKDKAYWSAMDLSVKIETILDRDCKTVKGALITGEQNNIDGDNTTISKDTQKVLRLADAYCK